GGPARQVDRFARTVTVHHGDEDQPGCSRNESRDQPFFEMIEQLVEHAQQIKAPLSIRNGRECTHSRPLVLFFGNRVRQFILTSSSLATRSSTSCPTRPLAQV